MKPYRCQEIAQLAHELTLSPLRHRLRQVIGIQRAIELMVPSRDYPYSFVCFQITGYRPRRMADSLLDGADAIADLVKLLDELTLATPLPAQFAKGRLYDVDAMARRFNVSTKTISRWRDRGLAGCWFVSGNGDGTAKPCLAFSERTVECFVSRNRELVRRGGAFQFMSADEKSYIVSRARELVAAERCGLHAVTSRIAEETGRAVETIRYTLRAFDREHPQEALFDRAEQAKVIDEGTVIYESYAAGGDIRSLATRFGRPEGEIRRILTRVRAIRLAAEPIEYIYDPSFDAPDAERRILGEGPPAGEKEHHSDSDVLLARTPSELPAYLRDLYRTPLLSREEERDLFRKMNFLLHQAEVLRQKVAASPESSSDRDITAIEELRDRALTLKNRIIQANLRLVVSIARRHLHGRPTANLFELVSDGNLALIRAVEKFDYAKGFRFSTYGSWAIMRGYARSIPDEMTREGRFQTGHDELLADARDHRETREDREAAAEAIRSTVAGGLQGLDDRERSILERHYGLGGVGATKTLDEIGSELGLSKERVRQIEIRALAKLRDTLGERGAALLAG
ncbi:MAG TPA: sigma-70 family RNA polymerase sigma factor [Phycisphaerae bacterium]|nr:sigma-70 family RNA polymerase sigma factor [Phycisphaerae bacterium]